jgi:hypothetical protein
VGGGGHHYPLKVSWRYFESAAKNYEALELSTLRMC